MKKFKIAECEYCETAFEIIWDDEVIEESNFCPGCGSDEHLKQSEIGYLI